MRACENPDVTTGWHVRPNNWEGQISVQREIVPRVSGYAGYTRRWYGNLFAQRNQNVLRIARRAVRMATLT